jgi:hypothetical protein
MIINKEYIQVKRKAKDGCLESLLDLADIYSQGIYGVEINENLYLNTLLKVTERIDELRKSKFSSSLVLYEIMYLYLERGNTLLAGNYLHLLAWELVWDYPNGDLEPYIEKYQIKEIAECLNVDMEEVIGLVKDFQNTFEPSAYKIVNVNHFFTI